MIAWTFALLLVASPLVENRREIVRDLDGLPLDRVRVVHELGDLRVLPAQTGGPPRATLDAVAAGEVVGREDAFLASVALEVSTDADGTTTVRSVFPPTETKPEGVSFAAHLTLHLPPGATLHVENRYGTVDVRDRAADVTIENRLGAVHVDGVAGAVDVSQEFGDVHVRDVRGPVTVTATSSPVHLEDVRGTIDVQTTFREVRMLGCTGDAVVENRNAPTIVERHDGSAELIVPYCAVEAHGVTGDLTVQGSQQAIVVEDVGGDLVLRHHLGSIDARRIGGDARLAANLTTVELHDVTGRAEVTSPSSSIHVTGAAGGAWVEGSAAPIVVEEIGGDVTVIGRDGLVRARWSRLPLAEGTTPTIVLQSRKSPIEIELPRDASVEVRAHTTGGSIDGAFDGLEVHGTGEVRSATLRLGDGRATIEATCERGDVRLRAAQDKRGSKP